MSTQTEQHSENFEAPAGAFFDPTRIEAAYKSLPWKAKDFLAEYNHLRTMAQTFESNGFRGRPGDLAQRFMRTLMPAVAEISSGGPSDEFVMGDHVYKVVHCEARSQDSMEIFRIEDGSRIAFTEPGMSFYRHDSVPVVELDINLRAAQLDHYVEFAADLQAAAEATQQ